MATKKKKKVIRAKKKTTKKRVLKRVAKKKTVKIKKSIKRPLKKKVSKRKKIQPGAIGIVTHYFPKVKAAVVKLKDSLTVGDAVKIKGHTTDFTQSINSMQIDHQVVNSAKKGEEIGLLVNSRVRQHDVVYKA